MKIKNLFISFVSLTVFVTLGFGVNAAENGRSRGGTMTTVVNSTARMPSIPIVTMNVVGNPAVTVIDEPAAVNNNGGNLPQPTPPTPTPPTPPVSHCADGGVQNTDYTIDMCMNDLQMCVNTSVTNGLAGLYNDEYFNGVLNGSLRICQNVIDKCLTVRKDCKNVYKTQRSVWLDFKIRVLQPSYYNLVLHKTGLTPYQAKRTCLRIGGRWDAISAECSVRVVAYNKGKKISNEWLFGAAGNGKDAEVWLTTGSSFSCGKSLFGFSLMNDTATAAVVGIGGGTVLGAATGGIIAKAKQNKAKRQALKDPCSDKDFRKTFGAKIAGSHNERVLMNYLVDPSSMSSEKTVSGDGYSDQYGYDPNTGTFYANRGGETSGNSLRTRKIDFYNLSAEECSAIIDLYSIANLYDEAVKMCAANEKNARIMKMLSAKMSSNSPFSTVYVETDGNGNITAFHMGQVVCNGSEGIGLSASDIAAFNEECLLKRLEVGFGIQNDDNPFCTAQTGCRSYVQIQQDLDALRSVLNQVEVVVEPAGSGPSVGKGMLVGGLVGAGVGGLATGITAVIEKNNISCKVEEDLGSVSFGKSYTIDSLKNLYVKYGMNLPDSIVANTPVTDKNSWGVACSEFQGKQEECENASVLYRRDSSSKREVVPFACSYSGSMCLMNKDTASLYGIQ